MPATIPPSSDYYANLLSQLQSQIDALARQQNAGIVDQNGKVRIKEGFQSDGTYGTWYFDTNGNAIVKLGATGSTYGGEIFDTAGNLRVDLGELANGDYGLSVKDILGNSQEVLPLVESYYSGSLSCSTSSPSTIANSPSVTVEIGASGDCRVTAGAYIGIPTNCTATAYVVVDGGSDHSMFALSNGSGGIAGNVQSTRTWKSWIGSGLSTGSHTFTMQYSCTSGTATFGANYLEVVPL